MFDLRQNARRARWRLRLVVDSIGDWFYGVDTVLGTGMPLARESSRFRDAHVNGPVSYWILRSYLDSSKLRTDEVFYDIGCGHGRVLCMVARRRVAKCIGVELSPTFAEKARANAAALRGRVSPIEVRVGDAAEMEYTDGTTFYFGDPFGSETMRAVLGRIGATLVTNPRAVRCIFVLPDEERSNEISRVIASSGWLHSESQQGLRYSRMRVEYWAWMPSQQRAA